MSPLPNPLEVEAKGIKDPVKIHEITGIGAPYNLQLEDSAKNAQDHCGRTCRLSFKRVTGKAIADESEEGALTAAAEGTRTTGNGG